VLRSLALAGRRDDVAAANPALAWAESSEFFAKVGALSLSPEFELQLRAVMDDGARVPLGLIGGRREAVGSAFEPSLAPLMLTSTGRAGSTVFMHLLGAHPQIVVFPPYDHEPRVASYWLEVLLSLAEPGSYLRQVAPMGPLHGRWWIGEEEPMPRGIRNKEVEAWLSADAVEELAGFCQSRIEALYTKLADSQGRGQATYFGEKFATDRIPALVWELYPKAREVFLVRDFRDVVCSIIASSAKRSGNREGRAPEVALADARGRTTALVAAWQQRGDRAHLVRYEDLVRDPAPTITALLRYLDVDSSDAVVDALVAALGERGTAADMHSTTPDQESSIGRWQRDLDPRLQKELSVQLRPGLELFGYAE
jgi:hypothetical protein